MYRIYTGSVPAKSGYIYIYNMYNIYNNNNLISNNLKKIDQGTNHVHPLPSC